jgi:hypothetical protein
MEYPHNPLDDSSILRLGQARVLHGPHAGAAGGCERALRAARRAAHVRGSGSIEEILAGIIIERKKRLNVHELREFEFLRQESRQHLRDLARQKAQERTISSKNLTAISGPRT